MHDMMLDLETWGTVPGSALRSIGAVMFDPYSDKMGAEFYVNIDRASCVEAGLIVDPGTERWWSEQTKVAQDALLVDPVPLLDALSDFRNWCRRSKVMFPWSQGANFDQPLIEAAMRAVGVAPPWKFWDSRCTRTAYSMGRFDQRSIRRIGTHHNALEDAKHQARCVQGAYKNIVPA